MSWIRYAAAGVCGGVAVWGLGLIASPTTPETSAQQTSAPHDEALMTDALVTELRGLREAIQKLAMPSPARPGQPRSSTQPTEVTRREVMDDSIDPITMGFSELQQTLREEFAALHSGLAQAGKGGTGGLQSLLRARSTDNGASVRQFCQRANDDEQLATKELRFLTPREVLLRFGNPTHVGNGGDYWSWEIFSPDGSEANMWVRFGTGYVTVAGGDISTD